MTPYWKAINARKTMKPSLLLALLIITAVSADDQAGGLASAPK